MLLVRLRLPCLLMLGLVNLHSDQSRSRRVRLLVVLWAWVVGSLLNGRSDLRFFPAVAGRPRRTKSVIESLLRQTQSVHLLLLEGAAFQESVVEACDQVEVGSRSLAVFAHLVAFVELASLEVAVVAVGFERVCSASIAFVGRRSAARCFVPAFVLVTP